MKDSIGDILENKAINEIKNDLKEEKQGVDIKEDTDENLFELDFTTSSAISKISLKYLILYTPIFFLSGLLVAAFWYDLNRNLELFNVPYLLIVLSPVIFFAMYFIFISGCVFFSKLFSYVRRKK